MTSEPEPQNSAERVIAAFGGARVLSEALGHKHPTTVQSWRGRGAIPQKYHKEIIDKAAAMGIIVTPEMFLDVVEVQAGSQVSVLTRLQTIKHLVEGVIADVAKTDPDFEARRAHRAERRGRRRREAAE